MRNSLVVLLGALLAGCASSPSEPPQRADGTAVTPRPKLHPEGVLARWQHRAGPDGTIPDDAFTRMQAERERVLGATDAGAATGLRNWVWKGPGNIGGRARALVIHPARPSTMWLGSVGGGIWKTTDGGASWFPLNGMLPVLAVSCMVMDPTDPNTIYAGTGEGGFFNNVDGSSNLAVPRGAGVFKTTDGGSTWNHVPSTTGPAWYFINRLAIDPNNNMVMLAATGSGIMRSTDAGASWTQTSAVHAMDVDFHPTDSMQAVAGTATGRAQYSTDGGKTWSNAIGPNGIRVEVAYCKGTPSTVYATESIATGSIRTYRSNDGGKIYSGPVGSSFQTWSRYNNALWVDPTDPNAIIVGGVSVYRSTNGGASRSSISSGSHADHHLFVEHPGFNGTTNRTVFGTNDGGVHRITDFRSSSSWQELNNNLGITQFYGAAINPTSGVIVGGAQDNGTKRATSTTETWDTLFGGDGGFCAADQGDPNYFYYGSQSLNLYRSSNGGNSETGIAGGIFEPDPNFISPFILDPNDQSRMLVGGERLWRTDNVKATSVSWRPIKSTSTNCFTGGSGGQAHFSVDPPCNISAVAVAPGNSDVVWVGHNVGHLFKTSNGTSNTPTWTRVDPPGLPDRQVSRIAVDPRDNSRVYVTFQGYAGDNVWRTTNAGVSWKQITGSGATALPAAPVTSIAVHRVLPGCLFVGTDIGVFWSGDDGQTWATSNQGAATAPIDELKWRDNKTLLVVSHGRGVYLADSGGDAAARAVGTGCGVGGAPALSAGPPVVGAMQTYALAGASAGAPVAMMFSSGPATPTDLGNGCTLQVALPVGFVVSAGATNGAGGWSASVAVPADKSLLDARLTAQVSIAVAGGPALGVAELSNGVDMIVGL